MATSYNGAPAYEDLRNVSPFNVKLSDGYVISFPQGVLDNAALRTLFTYTVLQWDARVEHLPRPPCNVAGYWGAGYRANRNNPASLSCHSSGTALDIWAVKHPNGVNTLTDGQKRTLAEISAETDHEIRFGIPGLGLAGWNPGATPDNMHAEARRYDPQAWARAAAALHPTRPTPTTTTPSGADTGVLDMNEAELRKIVREECSTVLLNTGLFGQKAWTVPVYLKAIAVKVGAKAKDK